MSDSQFAGLFVTATMADVSTAAADALNKATEALRLASLAMTNAATVYTSQASEPVAQSNTIYRSNTFLHDERPSRSDKSPYLHADHDAIARLQRPSQEALLPTTPPDVAAPPKFRKRFSGSEFNSPNVHRNTSRREVLSSRGLRDSFRRSRRYEEVGEELDQLNQAEMTWIRALHTDLHPHPPPQAHHADDYSPVAFTPTTAIGHDSQIHIRQFPIQNDYTPSQAATDHHSNPPTPQARLSHASSHAHPPPPRLQLPIEIAFLLVVCLAQFLTQAALAITIAPLPQETLTFTSGSRTPSPAWYSAAYALTLGTFILPSGRLGDVYGHRLLFLTGWIYFGITSILCGFAPYLAKSAGVDAEFWFIFMRAAQGLGPALLMPNAMALLGRMYVQGKKKNMIFALFGWNAPLGFVLGAVFTALFAQKCGWQWGFFVNGLLCFALFGLAFVAVPDLDAPAIDEKSGCTAKRKGMEMSFRETITRLDLKGASLGVGGLLLLNVALNQAPIVGWSTSYTYFLVILALIAFVLFILSQRPNKNAYPLIPLDVMDAQTLFVLACTFFGWSAFGVCIFYIWDFFLSTTDGPSMTSLNGGAWFAPAPIGGLFASAATGFLLSKLHPRWIQLFSMLAFFIGTTIMATAGLDRGESTSAQAYFTGAFWSIVIMPWGMDMSFPSATILLSNSLGHERQGLAASLANTVVNYSISIGLGIAGTVVRYGSDSIVDGASLMIHDIRHAIHTAMGLSGFGVLTALCFVGMGVWEERRKTRLERDGGNVV